MSWIYLALLAALSESLKDLLSKRGLRSVSPQLVALAAGATPIPILLSIVLFTNSVPLLGPRYGWALLIGGTLNIMALFQFMRALQSSDLSLAIPFVSFTPLFLLITSPFLVGDIPTTQDIVGIFCIVGGAYVLHIQSIHHGLLAPLLAIFREPGPRRMLSVAFIYSLTSNFDKIGVQNSSPLFWSLSISSVMTIGFVFLLRFLPAQNIAAPRRTTLSILLLVGLFQTIGLLVHNTALSLGPVPSVIAIKRSSILFAVMWGYLFLKEKYVWERLVGAVLMMIGVVVLGFGQTD
ncbi:EamA family transporter [Nitrospira sp. T9]|uniref:EamA family transporter n=1 Tax=unclassified Nitrospira TaxID=2652172 RepID=UPI003F9DD5E9